MKTKTSLTSQLFYYYAKTTVPAWRCKAYMYAIWRKKVKRRRYTKHGTRGATWGRVRETGRDLKGPAKRPRGEFESLARASSLVM